jgi:hypothetical protein
MNTCVLLRRIKVWKNEQKSFLTVSTYSVLHARHVFETELSVAISAYHNLFELLKQSHLLTDLNRYLLFFVKCST